MSTSVPLPRSAFHARGGTARRQEACFGAVPALTVDDVAAICEASPPPALASAVESMERAYATLLGNEWNPVSIAVDGIPVADVRRLRALEPTSFASLDIRTFGLTVRLSCTAAGHRLAVDDVEPLASRTFTDIRGILLKRSNGFVALVRSAWFVPAVVLASPVALSTAAVHYAAPVFDLCGVSLATGVLLLWLWWEHAVWRRRPMVAIRDGPADGAGESEER